MEVYRRGFGVENAAPTPPTEALGDPKGSELGKTQAAKGPGFLQLLLKPFLTSDDTRNTSFFS
jgi:hypothetical protein